ncbi:MAG: class IV adenylate cyclase [Candidatus Dojkabacteria bacterium]
MKRIEYKIREVSKARVLPILEAVGATKLFEGEMTTTYYDNPMVGFVKNGKRVSMRTKGEDTFLTFKNKYSNLNVSVADEYEVQLSDPRTFEKILEGLEYEPFIKFQKKRIDYKLDDVTFSFDKYLGEYDFVPEFLTIESDNDPIIFYWAQELGFSPEQCESITILDLIKEYQSSTKLLNE